MRAPPETGEQNPHQSGQCDGAQQVVTPGYADRHSRCQPWPACVIVYDARQSGQLSTRLVAAGEPDSAWSPQV